MNKSITDGAFAFNWKGFFSIIPERNIISAGNHIEIFSHRNYDVNLYSSIVLKVPAPQGHNECFVCNMIKTKFEFAVEYLNYFS